MKIAQTNTLHHHTVKDGNRMIGVIIGNDEQGYRAEYWVPSLLNEVQPDGSYVGPYGVKDSPWKDDQHMPNLLLWLEDQDALYRDKPQEALRQCR